MHVNFPELMKKDERFNEHEIEYGIRLWYSVTAMLNVHLVSLLITQDQMPCSTATCREEKLTNIANQPDFASIFGDTQGMILHTRTSTNVSQDNNAH